MVDSGVDPNPDTETAVIGGQAIASETDTLDEIARLEPRVQPGNHPDGHGTLMAMMMAAPMNGWGMVGIAPTSVRVYNMKALPKGQTTFPFNYYAVAIEECTQLHAKSPLVTVINLSLGGHYEPDGTEVARLENYVSIAHEAGLDVVAAAGNEDGPVLYPAVYPPILAVGAGEISPNTSTLCPFAARGEGLDVVAPGCDTRFGGLEGAFEDDGSPAVGSGSSQASALVAAALASMRAYAPQLTFTRAEECFTLASKNGFIDIAAAFEKCGLAQVVVEGKAAEELATGSSQIPAGPGSEVTKVVVGMSCASVGCMRPSQSSSVLAQRRTASQCPRPKRIQFSRLRSRFTLKARDAPRGCRLQVRWYANHGLRHSVRIARPRQPNLVWLVADRGLQKLQIRYVGGANKQASSWVAVRLTSK
jgi:subtilase family protein